MKHRKSFLAIALGLAVVSAATCPASAAETETPPVQTRPDSDRSDNSSLSKDDYYELYGLLADTVDQIDRNYVKKVDRRELMEAAIRGMMTKLDPYSAYISPDELAQFRSSVDSEFGGIGIEVNTDSGDLRVLTPIYGTPAYRAGIHAGDRIVEIDGHDTRKLAADEAIGLLKGADGSKISLAIVHAGQAKVEKFTLARERVHVETVLGDRRRGDDRWEFMYDEKNAIGYIRVTTFSPDTAKELRSALEDLKKRKVRGLVLDLRFNPGGLLRSAIEVSRLFISKGRIVSTKGRNSPERVWNAEELQAGGPEAFEGFPMVILANHYSASAAEIVSACLQDHQRAIIMGERTWGKGSVQSIIQLENGRSELKLTTAAYKRPSGKNIHRFPGAKDTDEWGVMPDLGYELALNDGETRALVAERRTRDIIAAHAGDDKAAAARAAVEHEPQARFGAAKSDAAARDVKPAALTKPFVDRQLEMALKYLRERQEKPKPASQRL